MNSKLTFAFAVVLLGALPVVAQIQTQVTPGQNQTAAAPATANNNDLKSDLKLGPGDLIHVTVYDMPELEQHVRISDQGNVTLSLIGEVKAAGLSAEDLGREIALRLREGDYAKRPSVTVLVEEYTTQGVTVVGEVMKPGVVPIFSTHNLLDILSDAGGLKDTASTEILIRRKGSDGEPERIQLGRDRASLAGAVAKVNPGDQVIVPLAGIVYMLGDLNRPGGYVMSENGKITMLQALAMAGGTTRTAAENNTRLLRPTANGYEEKTISLKNIMLGKEKDFELQPKDIVYVPFSHVKNFLLGTQSILGAATSASIIR
ncbi:MAG: polysaccharide biosynthesis/export family protein [Candidatus Acidiferrum sp.]|jgi:polysaccharide biosynthesis/export protein